MRKEKSLYLRLAEFYGANTLRAIKDPEVPLWKVASEAQLAWYHAGIALAAREGTEPGQVDGEEWGNENKQAQTSPSSNRG